MRSDVRTRLECRLPCEVPLSSSFLSFSAILPIGFSLLSRMRCVSLLGREKTRLSETERKRRRRRRRRRKHFHFLELTTDGACPQPNDTGCAVLTRRKSQNPRFTGKFLFSRTVCLDLTRPISLLGMPRPMQQRGPFCAIYLASHMYSSDGCIMPSNPTCGNRASVRPSAHDEIMPRSFTL